MTSVIRRAVVMFCAAPIAISIVVPLLVLCGPVSAGPSTSTTTGSAWQIEGIDELRPVEIERQLPNANPLNYYLYASRLFKEGENDRAVFWYHAGELRFKFQLLAHPGPPDAGQALFESMQATVGQPISLYAGSDTKKWPVYGMDVFDVLDKRQRLRFQPPAPAKDVDLEAYAGRYSAQPWHSEVAIVPWGMGLAALWLPSTDPAEDVEVLKPKGGDLFRRLRADGSEADEVRFERDNARRVYRFVEFSNPHDRLAEVSSGEPNKH